MTDNKLVPVTKITDVKTGDKVVLINLTTGKVYTDAEARAVGVTCFNFKHEGIISTAFLEGWVILKHADQFPENWPPRRDDVWDVKGVMTVKYHYIRTNSFDPLRMVCSAGHVLTLEEFLKKYNIKGNTVKLVYRA
jgi:hypothetical protein